MSKLENLKELLFFLPELFPPDLAAITLSNRTHFIGVWHRNNLLGNTLIKALYPGKELEDRVMLGLVIKEKRKITKYYTKEESIFHMPYLAVGVPIFEGDKLLGGICVIREDTILETQNRCQTLMQVHDILAESMQDTTNKLEHLVSSYNKTRKINNLMQEVNHKASLLQVNTLLQATSIDPKYKDNYLHLAKEIKLMANETKEAALQIIQLLNEFDIHTAGFFSSIRHVQVVVNNMNNSIDSIMNYLSQQSNLIINNTGNDNRS